MTSTSHDSQEHVFSYGIVALLSASLLLPFGLSYPTHHDPRIEPRAAAWEYLSDHYLLAHFALILALVLLAVGLFTLYYYVVLHRHITSRGSATAGIIASLIGIIFLVSGASVRGFALPDYAQTYVLMEQSSLAWFNLASFGNNNLFGGFQGNLLLTMGSGWLLRGVQESGEFPRWTILAYLLGMIVILIAGGMVFTEGLLGYGSMTQMLRILGGACIASAGIVWGRRMWQARIMFRAERSQFVEQN